MVRKLSVKNLSLLEIQELLEQKITQERKKLPRLIAKRDRLQSEVDALNQEIETIEGSGAAPKKATRRARKPSKTKVRGPRRRSGNRVTIPDAIEKILSRTKGPMSPNDITAKIKKSKHPSAQSKSLRLQVTTTLSKRPEFKRVGRGQYQLAK